MTSCIFSVLTQGVFEFTNTTISGLYFLFFFKNFRELKIMLSIVTNSNDKFAGLLYPSNLYFFFCKI